MTDSIFQDNGSLYDLFYESKDYEGECDFVEKAFRRFAAAPVKTIFDLGCGTGGHVLPLSARGYEVTGVDLSQTMLDRARRKAKKAGSTATFLHGDVRNVDAGRAFDAVISMFAVIGYQADESHMAAAFANARRHLEQDGLFMFDVWHGAAVLVQKPEAREREFSDGKGGTVTRSVTSVLDEGKQVVEVDVQVRRVSPEGEAEESEENHIVRYLFREQAETLLRDAGFESVHICAFPDIDRELSDDDWNMSVVARAA